MNYRMAAFDFDGTLADSNAWFLRVINELAVEFNFRPIGPEEQEVLRHYSSAEIMKHLGIPKWKLPRLVLESRKRAARDWEIITLFPGVENMLRTLRAMGLHVAIVSSNSEETIRKVLGNEIASAIDHYSCGASLFGKGAKLRAALRKSKVPASASIYIGDEIRDAVAAREVGMAFGAVSWGYTNVDALARENPQITFTDASQIATELGQKS